MARLPDSLAVVAGLSGVANHVLLYRHGEWDVKAPAIVTNYAIALAVMFSLDCLETLQKFQVDLNPGWSLKLFSFHVLGVYSSMLLYRGALHRLNRFPGPFLARLSNFYVTFLSARNFRLYEETQELHRKYGDYVRIGMLKLFPMTFNPKARAAAYAQQPLGPTELSISDPAAVAYIYSSKANVSKGPWYNCIEPRVSVQTDRDKASHAKRRKVWDQGFSTHALRDYEPRVVHYTSQLVQSIQKNLSKPMEMTRWFNYYAIDAMGDLSFGKSFDMISDGKDKYFYTQLHADMKMIGLFGHLMWLFPFFKRIPVINTDYLKFWGWLDEQVQQRRETPPNRPDIFHWLIKAFEQGSKTEQEFLNLHGDTYLISVAGSDTTAATLSNVFFQIAKDPVLQYNLRAELNEHSDLTAEQLAGLKLLNATINETIRLHPVVPSGMQRMTPPEGLQIGNTYIPGDVMVAMPMHTLFRDERVFEHPNEFKPERWTTHPELIKDSAAFIPFGGGPYACVGKQLALMEVRRVVAEILTRYEVTFADTFSENSYLKGKVDAFTLVAAPMELIFKEVEQT